MTIYYFCARCEEFVPGKNIHTIDIAERDKIYFYECDVCHFVWLEHGVWTEEDDISDLGENSE